MSWPLVPLQDVAFFQEGPGVRKWQFRTKGIKLINVKNIVNGVLNTSNSDKYLDEEEVSEKYSHFLADSGDLVMASSGATWGKTAWVEKKHLPLCMNTSMIRFKTLDQNRLDLSYLHYYLKTNDFRSSMEKLITGSAQPNFGSSHLKQIEIPLPPLTEQKRIAAILDKADVIRRKRQQTIQLADELLRSVFLDMFGDPVTNPKGWEVKPLANGIKSITSGWSAKGESYPCKDHELGVLKISSVTSGKFTPQENKFVHRDDISEGKRLVFPKRGDLVFSRANTRELVAATCIVLENQNNVFLPDKLWIVATDKNILLPEFLNYLIWEPRFKERLTSQATGTSGSMLNISKGKFEATHAIFPSLDLQAKFSSIFWEMQKLASSIDLSKDGIDESFSSLSQRAFSGCL